MPTKVIYFGVHGRAAAMRMLLTHAKVEFEDEMLGFDQFGPRKAAGEFPNGQLPCVQIDGKMYNESVAILRLLGNLHGYVPKDAFEAWDADAVVDFCGDFVSLYKPHFQGPHTDETKKDYAEKIEKFAAYFDKKLEKSGAKFICGDKMTIGDFQVASIVFNYVWNDSLGGGAEYFEKGREIVAKHAHVAKYVEVLKAENADYLAKRPNAPL